MDSFPDLDNTVVDQEYDGNSGNFKYATEDFAGLAAQGKRFRSEDIFIFQFNDEDKVKDLQIN
jgi:hypothetical protein